MSESALPLPAQSGPESAPGDEQPGNRRKLMLAGGAGLLVLLLVAVYFLFLSGGSSNSSAAPLVPHHAKKAAATTAAKAPAATVPSTFNNALARDPFKPLVVPPPPAPVGVVAGTATATATATTTGTAASNGQSVTLVKVYAKNGKTYAQTKVGNAVYSPTVGQNFGGTFQLLSVNGSAATYVQGDEQFSLSVGQVVLK